MWDEQKNRVTNYNKKCFSKIIKRTYPKRREKVGFFFHFISNELILCQFYRVKAVICTQLQSIKMRRSIYWKSRNYVIFKQLIELWFNSFTAKRIWDRSVFSKIAPSFDILFQDLWRFAQIWSQNCFLLLFCT